jgi:hypothetical protein
MLSITELMIASQRQQRTQALRQRAGQISSGQTNQGNVPPGNTEDERGTNGTVMVDQGGKGGKSQMVITERDCRVANVFNRIGGISACAVGDLEEAKRLAQVRVNVCAYMYGL